MSIGYLSSTDCSPYKPTSPYIASTVDERDGMRSETSVMDPMLKHIGSFDRIWGVRVYSPP